MLQQRVVVFDLGGVLVESAGRAAHGPAEPDQREGTRTKPCHFMPPHPGPQASTGLAEGL
jgi:hypothetical protein